MKLDESQRWPKRGGSSSTGSKRVDDYLFWMQNNLKCELNINKSTKIISLGSCFAREIKHWLTENKFNYLLGETDKMPWVSHEVFLGDKGRLPTDHSSIAWERVYNTFTLKHIVNYTFGEDMLDRRLLGVKVNGEKYSSDIIRNRILYPNTNVAKKDILDHISESRRMFLSADLIILTLGITEIWESPDRGVVAASNQFKNSPLPPDFKFRVSRYQENLDNLIYCYNVLKKFNPNLKFLVTVSPVHLLATFRGDMDVISASCNAKATLRAVADVFSGLSDVSYFPSYELATIAAPLNGVIPYPDGHHVSKDIIESIMGAFSYSCVKD